MVKIYSTKAKGKGDYLGITKKDWSVIERGHRMDGEV